MLFSFVKKSVPIAILLVILFASVSKGEEIKIGNILLKSNSNVPIVNPKLNQLYRQIPGDSTVKVWVFFTDKAVFTPENYYKSIENCRTNANPRALRRIKLRAKNKNFDFTDIPVAEEYVKKIEEMGLKIRVKSKWLNGVSLYANNEQLESLSQLPFVKSIDKVARYKRVEPEVAEVSIPKVYTTPKGTLLDYGASYPQLAQIDVPALHNLGYNGSGVLVCMMDVGFQKDHPAFARAFAEGRVLAEYDFINNDSNTQNEPGDSSNQDVHGTYTWSALGGEVEGQLYGPAYKADFLLAKTEYAPYPPDYGWEEDNWVAGAEWATDTWGADIISSSLGYNDWYTYQDMDGKTAKVTIAADLAASKGTLVVNAAGNERDDPWHYIIAPADGDSVLTVGAVDINGNITGFSSAGPTYDGRIKPDVVACGFETYCAVPGGVYGRVSGTSLSTPLVAGAAAILFQVDSTLSPMDVISVLHATASRACNPNNLYGWGVADVFDASGLSASPKICVEPDSLLFLGRQGMFNPPAESINISNIGKGTLNWKISGQNTWLAADLDSGTAPANVKLSVDMSAFGVGSQQDTIIISSDSASNSPQRVVIYVEITPATNEPILAYPNPFSKEVSIYIKANNSILGKVSVFTVSGTLIGECSTKYFADSKSYIAFWDGKNASGEKVADGIYLVNVRIGDKSQIVKIAKVSK